MMTEQNISLHLLEQESDRLAEEGKTPMYVAVDHQLAGVVAVADVVKASSKAAIERLHKMGIEVAMITGDNRKTAAAMSLRSVSVLSNALRLKRFKAQTGKEAVTSFDKVLNTEEISITADEVNKGWSLEAPDSSVRFIWSEDYSSSPFYDVMLEIDAKPFLDAGLDPEKLPENYVLYDGKLIIGVKYGENNFTYAEGSTPLSAFENLEKYYRSEIGYHASMGHYNVSLGDGNLFEWAQDMTTNDKDIVFAMNPVPLIDAGVDPEQVDGWSYAEVPVGHGKSSETVWKFLKPFDLI